MMSNYLKLTDNPRDKGQVQKHQNLTRSSVSLVLFTQQLSNKYVTKEQRFLENTRIKWEIWGQDSSIRKITRVAKVQRARKRNCKLISPSILIFCSYFSNKNHE